MNRHTVSTLTGATVVTNFTATTLHTGNLHTFVATAAGQQITAGGNLVMPANWVSAASGDSITFACADGANWTQVTSSPYAVVPTTAYLLEHERGGSIASGVASATRYLVLSDAAVVAGTAATAAKAGFEVNSALYAAGRPVKWRLDVYVTTNDVAPASNFTFELVQVTTTGGATGVNSITAVGSVLATAVVNTPAANTPRTAANSADFSLATAGMYAFRVTNSATIATAGDVVFRTMLRRRWV